MNSFTKKIGLLICLIGVLAPAYVLAVYLKPSDKIKYYNSQNTSSTGLRVTYPNGGEYLETGQRYQITWNQGNNVDQISIHYFFHPKDREYVIVHRINVEDKSGASGYSWKISEEIENQYGSFKIIIRGYRNGSKVNTDKSDDYFMILPADVKAPRVLADDLEVEDLKLKVTYPNGAENFIPGEKISIRWDQSYLNSIDIGYRLDNDGPVRWIAKDISVHPDQTRGSYLWQVPDLEDIYYQIYMLGERSSVGSAQDSGNDFFTITPDGSGLVGARLLQPEDAKPGEFLTINWEQDNIDTIDLYYTKQPLTLTSRFHQIIRGYDQAVTSKEGSYNWNIPVRLSSGYYAIKLVVRKGNLSVENSYPENYVWIGDRVGSEADRKIKLPVELSIDTEVVVLSSTVVKIKWQATAIETGSRIMLEYGLTPHYGRIYPFDIHRTKGTIILENLDPGRTYHFRLRLNSKTTPDSTFKIPGAIKRLGYYIQSSNHNSMQIRLTWDAVYNDFNIYFCKDICQTDNSDQWIKVGQTRSQTFTHFNLLSAKQSGFYQVVPAAIDNALSLGLGKTVRVTNNSVMPGQVKIITDYQPKTILNQNLFNLLKGKIILRIQSDGAAYYINPNTKVMHYLGRPNEALVILRSQGIGISNTDLLKIPLGLSTLSGKDSDHDGLPDKLENAIGSDRNNKDTDGDGYTDRLEVANNYSPVMWLRKLPIDLEFTQKHLGKVFIQVEGHGEAWYINPSDGHRYLITQPADALQVMSKLGIGISNSNFAAAR